MNKESFSLPPVTTNSSGEERTAGYEFEFTGLSLNDSASIISELYGGVIEQISSYEYKIKNTDFGDFSVELDAQLLRDKKYEPILKKIGLDIESFEDKKSIEKSLMEMASSVVPFEIVTPPVPLSRMHHLEKLINYLREKKAQGTKSSFFYAFGLHINPEIISEKVESLLNHLRAYVLLDAWVRKDASIDISRRLTPYINEYEKEYVKLILNEDYQPDLRRFIKDYFAFGNSRNRPLDLLPLFMHLDEEYTKRFLDESLTSARPTWHYRLPNCSLEVESWSLASEWNRWILVEKLADDSSALKELSSKYIELESQSILGFEAKWVGLMERWVISYG
ncbi:MAG: amidoligase family protein [Balneolaceae bacterium]|nr:amidoligase family protein [Balneolaceae bacterium]